MAATDHTTGLTAEGQVPAHIRDAHDQARDELRRADTKAQILLSLVGAALAGVIALTTRAVSIPTAAALWLAAVPIFAAVLMLLSALRPRLPKDPIPGTWLDAAVNGPAVLLDAEGVESAARVADDAARLGRIALCKYRRTATAVRLLKAGLCLAPVALLLAVTT